MKSNLDGLLSLISSAITNSSIDMGTQNSTLFALSFKGFAILEVLFVPRVPDVPPYWALEHRRQMPQS